MSRDKFKSGGVKYRLLLTQSTIPLSRAEELKRSSSCRDLRSQKEVSRWRDFLQYFLLASPCYWCLRFLRGRSRSSHPRATWIAMASVRFKSRSGRNNGVPTSAG